MPEWREQYVSRCESGFYDQSAPEVTIPIGMNVYWLDQPDDDAALNRPEMDAKDKDLGHPEVYEGRFSATGFFQNCTGVYYLVTDPIYVQSGRLCRGELMYMHVFDGSVGGARAGLMDGDGYFTGDYAKLPEQRALIEAPVTWGRWRSSRPGAPDFLPDREWAKLTTPEVVPTAGYVRLIVQFGSDYPAFAAGHFDVFRVEQFTEGGEPPGPPPEPTPGDYEVNLRVTGTIRRAENAGEVMQVRMRDLLPQGGIG